MIHGISTAHRLRSGSRLDSLRCGLNGCRSRLQGRISGYLAHHVGQRAFGLWHTVAARADTSRQQHSDQEQNGQATHLVL
jgi:hypothetical protein